MIGIEDLFSLIIIIFVLGGIKKFAKFDRMQNSILWALVLGVLFVFWFEVNLVNYLFFSTFCFVVIELLKVRLEYSLGFMFGFVFWMSVLDFVLLNDQLIVTLVIPGAKFVGVICFFLMYKILKKRKIV